MYKAIIFDMDGTVLDTLDGLTVSLNHILHHFKLEEKTRQQVRNYLGYGYIGLFRQAVPGLPEEQLAPLIDAFKVYYGSQCCALSKPYDGIIPALEQLQELGFKTAIVSNKGHGAVSELHNAFFDGIVSFSMGESEHYRKKPAPDMLWEALKRLDCAPEDAVYIGDSEVDRKTAAAAGMDCVLVSWGFRDKSMLKTLDPTALVDTPQELLSFFSKRN